MRPRQQLLFSTISQALALSYSLVGGGQALAQEQLVAQQPYQSQQGYPGQQQGYPPQSQQQYQNQPQQGYPQPQPGYPNQPDVPFGNAQGQPIQPAQAPMDPMTMPVPAVTPSASKPLQGGIEETGTVQDPSLSAGAAAFGANRPLQGGVEKRDRG